MVFLYISYIFPSFSYDFPSFSYDFPIFPSFSHGFPMAPWVPQVEEALGDSKGSGEVFEAELQHVSALAACAANMRVFDEGKWKSDVGPLEFFVFTFFDIFF